MSTIKFMRFLLFVTFTLLTFLKSFTIANAFFTEEYKKNILYGAFKKTYNTDLYLGIHSGFIVKTWTPNIITAISPNSNNVGMYSAAVPSSLDKKTSGRYTYSVGIDIGLHSSKSNFRHEINFEWYGIASKALNFNQNVSTIGGKQYGYAEINGKNISSLGTYADIYKFGYSMYYNFENILKMLGTKWDIFLGAGAGMALVNGGTYINSEILKSSYKDYKISSTKSAIKNRFTKSKAFAVAYHCKIGLLANISQSFAASVGLSFGATSRPLIATNFKSINKLNGMGSHLEYHIAMEIGLLLKAFSFSS